MNKRIAYKILTVVVICLLLGMTLLSVYFTKEQERSIFEQNERSLLKLTETTSQSVQTIMLAGYADIAQNLADNLTKVSGVVDFRIMHRNGHAAFTRNNTIDQVNERIGDEEFMPRDDESQVKVLSNKQRYFIEAKETLKTVRYYETADNGERLLTFLTPIENRKECQNCHGSDHQVRGVIKLTTSLEHIYAEIRHTRIGLAIAVTIITLLIILIIALMVRRISQPIMRIATQMHEIATGDGDLTVQLEARGQDEIASLSSGFNTFVNKIHHTIVDVADSTHSLQKLAEAVRTISAETSRSAGTQLLETERVAAAVNQMATTVEEVATSSDCAMQEAYQVNQMAAAGKRDVDNTIELIHRLKDKVSNADEAMSALGNNMVNINSILEMIHAVADQTNLLALNASIEAARAGEHGRGFAVVANEVRTLAERSRKSTEEIQSFFDQLLDSSDQVAKLMQECLEHADSSMVQADRSGESLDRITEVIKLIVEHNTAIASAMEENARGTEEINQAVVNINTGSKNTAQTAFASEQRSTELAHLSDRLESLVNQFKI